MTIAYASYQPFLTAVDGSLYFFGVTADGRGIWKLSSAGEPPELIHSGLMAGVQNLEAFRNDLYYVSDGDVWRSNGEAGGAMLIASPNELAYAFRSDGTNVYFFSYGLDGQRLWVTSTASERSLITMIGTGYDRDAPLILSGAGVLFAGKVINYDSELWFSDGTLAGTAKVVDRLAGLSGNPVEFVRIGDFAYFSAWNGLWKTDGTAEGTVRVKALTIASQVPLRLSSGYSAAMNGILYFVALGSGSSDYQLWRSDGTEAGTYVVKTINPTRDAFSVYVQNSFSSEGDASPYLAVVGDLLYFRANDGVNGLELWRSDGTADGTFMLTNVNTSSTKSAFASSNSSGHFPLLSTSLDGELYFRATNGVAAQGISLWKTDGTVAGTTQLDLPSIGASLPLGTIVAAAGSIYFAGGLGALGYGVWQYEVATDAVTLIKSVFSPHAQSNPVQLQAAEDYLYFTVPLSSSTLYPREELWRTDGTTDGLVRLFAPPPEFHQTQDFSQFATVGDELYFLRLVHGGSGIQLWRSGGDLENTLLVHESVGSARLKSSETGPLYFVRTGLASSPNAVELYVSDGTADGTTLIAGKRGEYGATLSTDFVVLNDQVILPAYVERYGSELWSADLTPDSTIPGDFDRNGKVDGADFLRWQRTFGASVNYSGAGADADANRRIDGDDFAVWATNFGAAIPPEPVPAKEQLLVAAMSHLAAFSVSAPVAETTCPASTPESIATPLAWFLLPGDVDLPRYQDRATNREEHLWLSDEQRFSSAPQPVTSQLRRPKAALTGGDAAEEPSAASCPPAVDLLDAIWDEALSRL